MSKTWKLAAIALAIFGTAQVSACGGSECGDGTTDNDGTCVVKTKISCGDGTKEAEGKCVLENTPVTCADGTTLANGVCTPNETCGAGTTADATGACVPDYNKVECATGTMLSEGVCVPAAESCAAGTTLTEGVCVADVICGEGTTAREGKCLTNDDLLKLDADLQEGTEENDTTYGGTPITITLPDASSSFSVAGNISSPEDKNQDGQLDQDFDYYKFTGTAGGYLNLKVLSKGAGSMGFIIQGPNDYLRIAPTNNESPSRQILLPYDGDYTVIVGPSRQLFNQSIGPDGGDEKDYLFVIENLGPFDMSQAPELDAAANQSASGRFLDLKDNAFKIKSAANQLVQITLPEIDVDAIASLILLDETGAVLGESGVAVRNGIAQIPATENGLSVVVDYVRVTGLRDNFSIQAKIPATETITTPIKGGQTVGLDGSAVVEAGNSLFVQIDVELKDGMDVAIPQGTVVLVNAPTSVTDSFRFRVFGPDNKLVEGFSGLNGFFARIGGKYTLEMTNADSLRPVELSQVSLQSYIPTDFGTFAQADAQKNLPMGTVPEGDFQFFTFETSEPMGMDFDVKQTTTPEAALVVAVLGTDLSIKGAYGGAAASYSYENVALPEAKRHLGLLFSQPGDIFTPGSDATGTEITIKPDVLPPSEVEPNGTPATATTVLAEQTLVGTIIGGPKQDLDLYKSAMAITEPSLLTATINVLDDTRVFTVQLRDSDGLLYDAADGFDGEINVGAIVQPGKDYYVYVSSGDGFDEATYTISMDVGSVDGATAETEPNNTQAEATTVQPQIMPSFSFTAAGTLAGAGDEDWFTFTVPTAGYYLFNIEGVEGLSSPQPNISIDVASEDGAGMVTPVPGGELRYIPAGKTLVKVKGGINSGFGNSYQIKGSFLTDTAQQLGQVTLNNPIDEFGTFNALGALLVEFELTQDAPMDGSQILTAWADAKITVYDPSLNNVFTPGNSGDGPIGAGFRNPQATAGRYLVFMQGDADADWQFSAGLYNNAQELEGAQADLNNTEATAESLGTLTAATPLYVFGEVSPTDGNDFFNFTVADVNADGSDVDVIIEHFQFGINIYDVDLILLYRDASLEDTDEPLEDYGFYTPQVLFNGLTPLKNQIINTEYYSGSGSTLSGQYMIRISVAP